MSATTASDKTSAAVIATVRDYFEGWFEGSAERMEAALHPTLVKRALRDDGSDIDRTQSAAEMIELTRNGRGRRFTMAQRRFEIETLDIYDGIATVVVRGEIYREYLHLALVGGQWKILHALWAPTEKYPANPRPA